MIKLIYNSYNDWNDYRLIWIDDKKDKMRPDEMFRCLDKPGFASLTSLKAEDKK